MGGYNLKRVCIEKRWSSVSQRLGLDFPGASLLASVLPSFVGRSSQVATGK
jgi:hypothetical protein